MAIIVCVAFFVYTGMEHCVANMFYLAVANQYINNPVASILSILISTIGNGLGAIVLHDIVNTTSLRHII